MLFIISIAFTVSLYVMYKWYDQREYFTKRNVPHLKPYWFLGNTGGYCLKRHAPNDFITYLYNSFPTKNIFGLFDFWKPFLFVRDPGILQQLAIKDFDHFTDHQLFFHKESDDLFGNSLMMMHGDKWRDMRASMRSAFTGHNMRLMFELVQDCAVDMCSFLRKQSVEGDELNFEMKELFQKYTTDVIASAAFGIKVNSFENVRNPFYVTGNKILDFSIKSIVKLLLLRIAPLPMRLLNIQYFDANVLQFFQSVVLDTIKSRERENIFRPDMLNILMELRKSSQNIENDKSCANKKNNVINRQWSDKEIVSQCFFFFVAGYDTSSTLLSCVAYELALNPDAQDKLYLETAKSHSRLNGSHLDYEKLRELKYLDQIVSETLRLWPPGLYTDRQCVKDYEYNDGDIKFTIEKGMAFCIPVYALHHDSKYFSNPHQFDPERFNADNRKNIVPGTYLPFGIGPRSCLGSRFAHMEVKAIIYHLILKFKFETNEKTQIPLKMAKNPTGMVPENGIHVRLVPRS